MRDLGNSFPIGIDNRFTVLKWKIKNRTDEALVPLHITFWPSEENGYSVVSVEYESKSDHLELNGVIITIPVPGISDAPKITEVFFFFFFFFFFFSIFLIVVAGRHFADLLLFFIYIYINS